ncbi:hypothetical protein TIFTF001_026579 [Ficus carica]|uniref:Disease resistance RPP13-like protein 1 n=1 Tax=Ficus carica TaxID=3494 RepID=A0AA88ITN6_FICCA|nr:hypothetical protein TIFTF001_026579 [Ficus carica]
MRVAICSHPAGTGFHRPRQIGGEEERNGQRDEREWRITSSDFVDFIQQNEALNEQIKKLTVVLTSVNAVLNDAEGKQFEDPAVKVWLDEMKGAISDAEDLVDEINTRALGRSLEGESGNDVSVVWRCFSTSLADFFSSTKSRVVEILDRVEFMLKQKDVLGLKEGVLISRSRGSPMVPLEQNSNVYGRDDDKENIIRFLLSDVACERRKVSLISIVGMCGIGKTTLAQIVYDDERVKNAFHLRAWIHVSYEFDVLGLTMKAFEVVTQQRCPINDLHFLQHQLRAHLEGKRFFFVLDDVWNENYIHWDVFKRPFEFGACGSKIVVTTRSQTIAFMMGSVKTKQLQPISDDNSWSLFQQMRRNSKVVLFMHDLVHDLATFVLGGSCHRWGNDDSHVLASKTRHLSFMNEKISEDDGIRKFEKSVLSKSNRLRTFLPVGKTKKASSRRNLVIPKISTEQRLRVISFVGYSIKELPPSISNLKHLRYLNLSYSKVRVIPTTIGALYNLQTLLLKGCSDLIQLPDSIGDLKRLRYMDLSNSKALKKLPDRVCDLCNLQTLKLSYCKKLTHLPSDMGRLTSLRHLNIDSTNLERMPPQMGKMKALESLSCFVLEMQTESSIKELEELQKLRGCLEISGLENVIGTANVSQANLKDKKHLSKLVLDWRSGTPLCDSQSQGRTDVVQVLDKLEPHAFLKELSICSYSGERFPGWVGDVSFCKMVMVTLVDCRHCSSLPPLGQLPSLRTLSIRGFDQLERIGAEFYASSNIAAFQSLKTLIFEDMPQWREWETVGGDQSFPRLEVLCLINCPRMTNHVRLPERLAALIDH